MLVREVGECIDVLNHYKPRDGAWTAAVFREVLGDCIGALQRVQSFLGESITRVARVPPDDERRELLQLLMQTVMKVPQACSQLAQHRMEMAWLGSSQTRCHHKRSQMKQRHHRGGCVVCNWLAISRC